MILLTCDHCGYDHYFKVDSLPGGPEHCEYCEVCARKLPKPPTQKENERGPDIL